MPALRFPFRRSGLRLPARLAPALLAAACTAPAAPPQGALMAVNTEGRIESRPEAPATDDGTCWAQATQPALIQTITKQVQTRPAQHDSEGKLTAPAIYDTRTRQDILRERSDIWFETPCAAEMDLAFIATLQRALTVRGYYAGPITGALDGPTRAAIKAYQTPRGLESATLSLQPARQLGVAAYGRETPPDTSAADTENAG